jgi:hypothetical protein
VCFYEEAERQHKYRNIITFQIHFICCTVSIHIYFKLFILVTERDQADLFIK